LHHVVNGKLDEVQALNGLQRIVTDINALIGRQLLGRLDGLLEAWPLR